MGQGTSSDLKKERLAKIVACVINNPGIGTAGIGDALMILKKRLLADARILTDLHLIRYDAKQRGWFPGSKATP